MEGSSVDSKLIVRRQARGSYEATFNIDTAMRGRTFDAERKIYQCKKEGEGYKLLRSSAETGKYSDRCGLTFVKVASSSNDYNYCENILLIGDVETKLERDFGTGGKSRLSVNIVGSSTFQMRISNCEGEVPKIKLNGMDHISLTMMRNNSDDKDNLDNHDCSKDWSSAFVETTDDADEGESYCIVLWMTRQKEGHEDKAPSNIMQTKCDDVHDCTDIGNLMNKADGSGATYSYNVGVIVQGVIKSSDERLITKANHETITKMRHFDSCVDGAVCLKIPTIDLGSLNMSDVAIDFPSVDISTEEIESLWDKIADTFSDIGDFFGSVLGWMADFPWVPILIGVVVLVIVVIVILACCSTRLGSSWKDVFMNMGKAMKMGAKKAKESAKEMMAKTRRTFENTKNVEKWRNSLSSNVSITKEFRKAVHEMAKSLNLETIKAKELLEVVISVIMDYAESDEFHKECKEAHEEKKVKVKVEEEEKKSSEWSMLNKEWPKMISQVVILSQMNLYKELDVGMKMEWERENGESLKKPEEIKNRISSWRDIMSNFIFFSGVARTVNKTNGGEDGSAARLAEKYKNMTGSTVWLRNDMVILENTSEMRSVTMIRSVGGDLVKVGDDNRGAKDHLCHIYMNEISGERYSDMKHVMNMASV
jgi:hypothetical protein